MVYSTASLELILFIAIGVFLAGLAALFFGNKKDDDARMAVGLILVLTGIVCSASVIIKIMRG